MEMEWTSGVWECRGIHQGLNEQIIDRFFRLGYVHIMAHHAIRSRTR